MSQPTGVAILRMLASIEEYLAHVWRSVNDLHQQGGGLYVPKQKWTGRELKAWQAESRRMVAPEIIHTRLANRLGPRLRRGHFRIQIVVGERHAREIRLAVRGSGRWPGDVPVKIAAAGGQ